MHVAAAAIVERIDGRCLLPDDAGEPMETMDLSRQDHDAGPPPRPLREVRGLELLDEIEAGGMAHVYRARRITDGSIVAVKVIHIDNMAPDYEARLRREPEVQRGIGHDNIVRLQESFREHDEFFLVMEFVDGRSLARLIHAESGPLPFERARGYFRQVLRAVDHLHRVGIVHRDIKPSNILVRWDDVVKLADFGIAKFIWQQGATATRQGLGTPQYMSPEQVRGEAIDQRTDIYSLGASLFEMLTGRMPFSRDASTPMAYAEVIRDVLDLPLPDPRTFQPMIPSAAVALIERATAKDREDRFATVGELAEALEAIEADPIASPTVVIGRAPTMSPAPPRDDRAAPMDYPATLAGEGRPWRLDRLTIVLGVLFLGALGAAVYMALRPGGSSMGITRAAPIGGERMLAITGEIARHYERGMKGCSADSVALLYGATEVAYFNRGLIGRPAIAADLTGFCDGVQGVDLFSVRVDSMRNAGGGIDAWWTVVSRRTLRSDTTYRDTSVDLLHLSPLEGGWRITAQRHLWSKHYSIAPPAKPHAPVARPRPRASRSDTLPVRAVVTEPIVPREILKKLEKRIEHGKKKGWKGGRGRHGDG